MKTETPQTKNVPAVVQPPLVRLLRWDHPAYYPVRCNHCGWEGMSDETAGGNQIADTGDHNECVCPKCIAPDGDYEKGEWHPVVDIPKPSDELPDDHPLWCVNEQIKGLLTGDGATEDHAGVLAFLSGTELPSGTVARIHRALVCAEVRLPNSPDQ